MAYRDAFAEEILNLGGRYPPELKRRSSLNRSVRLCISDIARRFRNDLAEARIEHDEVYST